MTDLAHPRALPALAVFAVALLGLAAEAGAATCRLEEGSALFEARKFAEARRALEPCAATDAKANLYLGRASIAEGDFEHAIPSLEKAVALEPKSSDAHMWLGRAMAQKARRRTSSSRLLSPRRSTGGSKRPWRSTPPASKRAFR